MTDHKYTDEEVIKGLECCTNCICNHAKTDTECPLVKMAFCKNYLMKQSLALINRQKVEIERLQAVHADMTESLRLAAEANKDISVELDAMRGAANSYKMHYETARAEAIKEFAKKIKTDAQWICDDNYIEGALIKYVDTLVKEMTENKR